MEGAVARRGARLSARPTARPPSSSPLPWVAGPTPGRRGHPSGDSGGRRLRREQRVPQARAAMYPARTGTGPAGQASSPASAAAKLASSTAPRPSGTRRRGGCRRSCGSRRAARRSRCSSAGRRPAARLPRSRGVSRSRAGRRAGVRAWQVSARSSDRAVDRAARGGRSGPTVRPLRCRRLLRRRRGASPSSRSGATRPRGAPGRRRAALGRAPRKGDDELTLGAGRQQLEVPQGGEGTEADRVVEQVGRVQKLAEAAAGASVRRPLPRRPRSAEPP